MKRKNYNFRVENFKMNVVITLMKSRNTSLELEEKYSLNTRHSCV